MDYDSKSADILETEGYKESGIFIKKRVNVLFSVKVKSTNYVPPFDKYV